jgi:hypothetical protein
MQKQKGPQRCAGLEEWVRGGSARLAAQESRDFEMIVF